MNKSIQCTVTQCKNHAGEVNYCDLLEIQVGTHEAHPKVPQCTDCYSFELK